MLIYQMTILTAKIQNQFYYFAATKNAEMIHVGMVKRYTLTLNR